MATSIKRKRFQINGNQLSFFNQQEMFRNKNEKLVLILLLSLFLSLLFIV